MLHVCYSRQLKEASENIWQLYLANQVKLHSAKRFQNSLILANAIFSTTPNVFYTIPNSQSYELGKQAEYVGFPTEKIHGVKVWIPKGKTLYKSQLKKPTQVLIQISYKITSCFIYLIFHNLLKLTGQWNQFTHTVLIQGTFILFWSIRHT